MFLELEHWFEAEHVKIVGGLILGPEMMKNNPKWTYMYMYMSRKCDRIGLFINMIYVSSPYNIDMKLDAWQIKIV